MKRSEEENLDPGMIGFEGGTVSNSSGTEVLYRDFNND